MRKSEYNNHRAICRGFKNHEDYLNHWAIKKGFKNANDYRQYRVHITGRKKPMSENKGCASYLGVYITESVLCKIFEGAKRMPYGNPGYDFVCQKGYKIDVKTSCLRKNTKNTSIWKFNLNQNTVADFFLLLGFDNRNDLNPMHVWLIENDTPLTSIAITNSENVLDLYKQYEQTDKLDKLINCCEQFEVSK